MSSFIPFTFGHNELPTNLPPHQALLLLGRAAQSPQEKIDRRTSFGEKVQEQQIAVVAAASLQPLQLAAALINGTLGNQVGVVQRVLSRVLPSSPSGIGFSFDEKDFRGGDPDKARPLRTKVGSDRLGAALLDIVDASMNPPAEGLEAYGRRRIDEALEQVRNDVARAQEWAATYSPTIGLQTADAGSLIS